MASALRLAALPAVLAGLVIAGGAAVPSAGANLADLSPLDAARNTVSAFGGAADLGPEPGMVVNAPVLDIASHPAADGYWLAAADGGVFAFGAARFHGSTGHLLLNAPIVGIAPTPTGAGYWLAAADGGVFGFGDAAFHGSMGGRTIRSPILGIAPTPTGAGYWLVAADGGVFAFGDAAFHGSAAGVSLQSPVVEIAPMPTGGGYWLLAADGGVFGFGDAPFLGSRVDLERLDAVDITAAPDGEGYWVARSSGVVQAFGAPHHGDILSVDLLAALHPTVGIAARPAGGYWVAQGERPRAQPEVVAAPDLSQHPFLVCTRRIESGGNYAAVNPSGKYRGAYQFSRSTWDATARHAGRIDLVGVDPAAAPPPDQDFMALHLYHWQGASPWLGRCAGL